MLEELTPEEFDYWLAFDRLEPIDEWLHTATLGSLSHNVGLLIASAASGAKLDQFLAPADLLPGEEKAQKQTGRRLSAAAAEAQLRARFGV